VSPFATARRLHVALVELCGNGVVACNARPLDLLNDRQHVDRKLPRIRSYSGHVTKSMFFVAAFVFAVAFGILNAKVAQSDNDRASSPTIRTMALLY
jgi:hypothetical protein